MHGISEKVKLFSTPREEVLPARPENIAEELSWAGDAPSGTYAFALNAMLKGQFGNELGASESDSIGKIASLFTHNFGVLPPASLHGGWGWMLGIGEAFYKVVTDPNPLKRSPRWFLQGLFSPAFTGRLKVDPVFGVTVPSGCDGLFDAIQGSTVAADARKMHCILAQMIPERSLPAGGAGGSGVGGVVLMLEDKIEIGTEGGQIETFDMEANRTNGECPTSRDDIVFGNGWRLGVVKIVAYCDVWKAWQVLVDDANLNKEP